ncbi:MAG: HAMP domain-containing sensor histidine kinase, partial [Pseudomonadota bacterium]
SKWRPSLWMIVSGVLVTVVALPVVTFFVLARAAGLDPLAINSAALSALVLGLIAAAIVGFVFVRAITRPLQDLGARAQALARGERDAMEPLAWHGSADVAALSSSLFAMAKALFSRSDYISTFATHVSHEIKTPLSAIRGAAELLDDDDGTMSPAERARFLENIRADVARVSTLLERLRDLAEADNPRIAGSTTISRVLAGLSVSLPEGDNGLRVRVDGDPQTSIAMTEENASIVFGNLIENARLAAAACITISVKPVSDGVKLIVQDDGPGFTSDGAARAFDLFYTTRRADGGTGMGLSIVRSMLIAHGGSIRIVTDAKRSSCDEIAGAVFDIFLPYGV